MLTPGVGQRRNIWAATPVCVRMPAPTADTFDTLVPCRTVPAPSCFTAACAAVSASARSSCGTVNETSARPAWADVLHDHVDGNFPLAPSRRRCSSSRRAGRAVRRRLTRASFRTSATPVTTGRFVVPMRGDQRARAVGVRRPHAQRHAVLLRELDRAGVHHAARPGWPVPAFHRRRCGRSCGPLSRSAGSVVKTPSTSV